MTQNNNWNIRMREHNMFQGNTIVQVCKGDDIRGSFTIYEDEKDAIEFWRKLLPSTSDNRGDSKSS